MKSEIIKAVLSLAGACATFVAGHNTGRLNLSTATAGWQDWGLMVALPMVIAAVALVARWVMRAHATVTAVLPPPGVPTWLVTGVTDRAVVMDVEGLNALAVEITRLKALKGAKP